MTHAFFLVMGGFVWEDEHSILHPVTVEDLYEQCEADEDFTNPKLIQTDGLRIPLYSSPSSGAQATVISSTLGTVPYSGRAVPLAGANSAGDLPLFNGSHDAPTNNQSAAPLIDLIACISEADIMDKSAGDGMSKLVAMVQVVWFVTQLIGRNAAEIAIAELEVVTAGYAVINLVTYILWWSKPLLINQQIVLYSRRVQDADPPPLVPIPKIARRNHTRALQLLQVFGNFLIGAWKSTFGGYKRSSIGGKVGLLRAGMWDDATDVTAIFSILLASVFGSIHLAAWNFHFFSLLEMWLWRSTSLAITAIPLLLILGGSLLAVLPGGTSVVYAVGYSTAFILPILYVNCRVLLLVLPLIQLKSLPPDAFLIVPWSTVIPHI
jgi:hypothetical protein